MVVASQGAGGLVSPRATGLLAVVALALGLFVYINEIEGDVARQAEADEESKIHTGIDPAEIDAIALTTLDGIHARFERDEGRWMLVAPVVGRADATGLDAMTNALANLPREGTVGRATPDRLDGFGLGAQAKTIRFEVGGEGRGLRIGGSTPVGGHRYVAPLSADDVAFVASYRVNAFDRNLDDLRDRRVFTFEDGAVKSLTLSWPGSGGEERFEIELVRAEDGEGEDGPGGWQIARPISAQADPEVVRDLVSDLTFLRASGFLEGFVDGPRPDSEGAGSASELLTLEWTLEGESIPQRARIMSASVTGSEATPATERVIELDSGDRYLIAAERVEAISSDLDEYRFKRLAEFELASARRLELEFAGTTTEDGQPLRVLATLEASGWSSPGRDLDPDRTTKLIRDLSNLSADSIFADEMGVAELASLGLVPPQGQISVEGGPDPSAPIRPLAQLRFGRLDPNRGLFVKRADRSTIFLVAPEVAALLPYSANYYEAEFEIPALPEELDVESESTEEAEPIAPIGAP